MKRYPSEKQILATLRTMPRSGTSKIATALREDTNLQASTEWLRTQLKQLLAEGKVNLRNAGSKEGPVFVWWASDPEETCVFCDEQRPAHEASSAGLPSNDRMQLAHLLCWRRRLLQPSTERLHQ